MYLVRHGQSEFNLHFKETRVDPLIIDPNLTEVGKIQANQVADWLETRAAFQQIIVSPYKRALQTAEIIALRLKLPCTIDAQLGEHAVYHCDIGSPVQELKSLWPEWSFDQLDEIWWPNLGETFETVQNRSRLFYQRLRQQPYFDNAIIISHWGFIRSLTDLEVGNCGIVQCPASSPQDAKILHQIDSYVY